MTWCSPPALRQAIVLRTAMLSLMAWSAFARPAFAERPAPDVAAGRAEYVRSCARCHGVEGAGDGIDAKRFYPRPRDFRLGIYKFRSTASGTAPTDEDLFRTVTHGLPGSNMPDWPHLDESIRWHLVEYLKSLAPIFQEAPAEPMAVAADPGKPHADLAKGRALYEKLGCAACHGPTGRANGSSAGGLVDDWGMPIRPANLAQGWNYRGGSDAESVMRRFLSGIDGAGMPSYAGTISPEDAWHLAYYVVSLQEPPRWNRIARATRVRGELPKAIDHPAWHQAERTDVRLRSVVTTAGEWAKAPTVTQVAFQVLYDEETLAIKLAWDDPTENTQGPADALAVVFKPAGLAGDVVTLQAWPHEGSSALDLWHWSAATKRAGETLSPNFDVITAGGQAAGIERSSAARYADGRWQVVLQRPLASPDLEGGAVLNPDELPTLAFAIWDGSHASERAVSPWIDVALRPLKPVQHAQE